MLRNLRPGLLVYSALGSLFLALQSCSMISISSGSIDEKVHIERDGFSGQTWYIAEPLENEDDDQNAPAAESVAELYLSAERFAEGTIRYYINVTNDYRHNLRDFLFAIDSDGYKLRGNWIAHQLNCRAFCRYDEHLQIELNDSYLRDKARTGLKFRLYGPPMKAFAPVHVPGAYISSFLASVDGKR